MSSIFIKGKICWNVKSFLVYVEIKIIQKYFQAEVTTVYNSPETKAEFIFTMPIQSQVDK